MQAFAFRAHGGPTGHARHLREIEEKAAKRKRTRTGYWSCVAFVPSSHADQARAALTRPLYAPPASFPSTGSILPVLTASARRRTASSMTTTTTTSTATTTRRPHAPSLATPLVLRRLSLPSPLILPPPIGAPHTSPSRPPSTSRVACSLSQICVPRSSPMKPPFLPRPTPAHTRRPCKRATGASLRARGPEGSEGGRIFMVERREELQGSLKSKGMGCW